MSAPFAENETFDGLSRPTNWTSANVAAEHVPDRVVEVLGALRRAVGFIRAANWRFQKRNFSNRINLIWPVQSCLQKFFRSRLTQITS
jgi:hypothetical protein